MKDGYYVIVVDGCSDDFKRIGLKIEESLKAEKIKRYWFDTDPNKAIGIINFGKKVVEKKKQWEIVDEDKLLCIECYSKVVKV